MICRNKDNRTSHYHPPNLGEKNHEVMGEVNIQIICRDDGLPRPVFLSSHFPHSDFFSFFLFKNPYTSHNFKSSIKTMPFSQKFTIYNTLTRQKEIFQPLFDEGKKDFVGIYSCGPTVYRDPHIGNLKAVCFADMLRSTIRDILGYPVKHVMNLTDVGHLTDDGNDGEDKMEKGARRENKTVWELAEIYIAKFYHCLDSLHVERFDVMPRATDHIKEQIEMIKVLEEKGYTYTIEHDGIYMDTSKVEEYGKLAQLEKQDLKA